MNGDYENYYREFHGVINQEDFGSEMYLSDIAKRIKDDEIFNSIMRNRAKQRLEIETQEED